MTKIMNEMRKFYAKYLFIVKFTKLCAEVRAHNTVQKFERI